MGVVIDASIVVAWLLAETSEPRVAAAFEAMARGEAMAPVILHFELRNALVVSERRGRLTAAQSGAFLRELAKLQLRLLPPAEGEHVLALARSQNLTVYDAAYLDLAKREALPLATLDRGLETAARAEGVALFGA